MEKYIELKKISVVIPMYNAEKTIKRALDSVIAQTYKGEIEIIVVNDGSKDNSAKIVSDYILNNPNKNIKLINQDNGGVSKARNTGLKASTGEYIALLDSDDAWLKNKLIIQMKYFDELDVDFICALRNNETITYPYILTNGYAIISLKKLLLKVVGQTSTSIFKKEIITTTGLFDENQKYSEDANYWLKIASNHKMIIIDEKLVITDNDYGNEGLSSNIEEMFKGVQKNNLEMYKMKNITYSEYIFFKYLTKLKYYYRIFKL